jgi:hypothetical protein
MGVDNSIPEVTCGFNSQFAATSPNGTSILILDENDGNYADTGFFFDIQENCPENITVTISVETNELVKSLQDMVVLQPVKNLQGVTQVILCVDSGFCGESSMDNAGSFCIRDPEPQVTTRFYEITVEATDPAGNKDSEICVVFVEPSMERSKNAGAIQSRQELDALWNSYALLSQTRIILEKVVVDWDNVLAPSDVPSMAPSVSLMPSVSQEPSSSPSATPSLSQQPSSSPSSSPSISLEPSISMMPTGKKSGFLSNRSKSSKSPKSVSSFDQDLSLLRSKKGSSSDAEDAALESGGVGAGDNVCNICPPGQCFQEPAQVYPQEDAKVVYKSTNGAGLSYNKKEVPHFDVTCAAVEILASIPGAMRGSYCNKLKEDAKDGTCGGCGILGCAL